MAVEIAAAYVTIMPSLQGAVKSIQNELGGVNTTAVGRSVGGGFASNIAAGMKTLGGMATGALATVTTAVGTLAVGGGISRALQIENAQAKLKGLGHDASSVTEIMNDALASVKGTAYGLGDAASVAAGLSAAGVKQGAQLTGVLKTVADTASISGRSLTDIGTIFQSVAARGKLQGDDMLQLMSSGVPVLQLLANQTGKTSAQVSAMVSAGQIDFATFAAAMQAGMGGAALAAGGTFTGALDNVKAALSRLGAAAATPALDLLRQTFNAAIPVIDQVTAALTPLINALTGRLQAAMPGVAAGFTSVGNAVTKLTTGGFGDLSTQLAAIAPLAAAAFGPFLKTIPFIGDKLPIIGAGLGGVIGLLGTMLAVSPSLRAALGGAFQQLMIALQPVWGSLNSIMSEVGVLIGLFADMATRIIGTGIQFGVFTAAGKIIAGLAKALAVVLDFVIQNSDWIGALAVGVGAAVAVFKAWIAAVKLWTTITKVAAAVQAAFNVVLDANPIGIIILAIAALVAGLVWFFTQTKLGQTIWSSFVSFLTSTWNTIVSVATTVFTALGSFFSTVWNGIVAVWTNVWNTVVAIFTPIIQGIATAFNVYFTIIKNVLTVFAAFWVAAWQGWSAVFQAVWNGIVAFFTPIINTIASVITSVVGAVQAVWNAVWGAISGYFVACWNNMVAFYGPIIAAIASVISSTINWIAGVWNSVWGSISGFFSGIWNGMVGAVRGAVSAIAGVVGTIYGAVTGALKGAEKWLVDVGKNIVQGLINGITGAFKWLKDTITDLGKNVLDWAKNVLGIHSPSRLFRLEVGQMVGAGMVLGIQDSYGDIQDAVSGMVQIPSTYSPSPKAFGVAGTAGAGASGVNVNMHVDTRNFDPATAVDQMSVALAQRLRLV